MNKPTLSDQQEVLRKAVDILTEQGVTANDYRRISLEMAIDDHEKDFDGSRQDDEPCWSVTRAGSGECKYVAQAREIVRAHDDAAGTADG